MKNEVIDVLLSRHSCKNYTDELPTKEELETIVNTGLFAPSGMNKQTTLLVCITNKEIRDKLSKLNAKVMNAEHDPFYNAPAVIAVLGDSSSNMYVQDASLAMENMQLAAHSLGLGSCWIHRAYEVFKYEEGKQLKKDWNIADSYEGVAFCVIGHEADKNVTIKPRRENRMIVIE